jgi:GTPase SAR1 family protein
MALNHEQLNKFRKQKERLGTMLADSANVISKLNMTSASDTLSKLSEKVNNDTFKIQVVGTFNNGKSSVINALLGEEVLPAYVLPTTAVINEVKYGEKKEAILYFRNPLPEKLPNSLSPKAKSHMEKYNNQNIPPLVIDYNEIEDYVVIPIGEDPTEMLMESPYEKVELFWPLEMLKQGVEIIDTPGLNESETRAKVTMEYLAKADAILLVLAADKLCAQDEMDFIENNLNAYGFTDLFFVVNRFDLIPERQKDCVRQFAEMKLSHYSTNKIYYISALKAIEGTIQNDYPKVETSGILPFVSNLTDFLTKDKGKIKLSQPARKLKHIINNEALYKIIPSQRAMLDSSLDDVKDRYEKAKPQLETLKTKRNQIVKKLNSRIEQSRYEFQRAINNNTFAIANMIPCWIDSFNPKGSFIPLHPKESAKKITLEISDYITQKIQEQQKKWKDEVMLPLANEKAQYIFDSADKDLTNLYSQLDSITVALSGNQDIETKIVPLWQRIAGAGAGVLLGMPDVAIAGGMTGLTKDLIKNLGIVIGTEAILILIVGALNPLVLIGGMIAGLLGGGALNSSTTVGKIKKKLAEQYVNSICKNAEENSVSFASKICQQLSDISDDISTAVEGEIKNVEQQVNGIIKEMEKGQSNIDARKKVLDSCEANIKDICSDLDAFTFDLIEQK